MTRNRLETVDLTARFADQDTYESQLKALQTALRDLQTACYHNGERVVIVFEGWDASGKGGTIRRLREKLDPRSYRVHPIGRPDEKETGEHYLQRFWRKMPARGEIAIFDRSWYGRVLVERIEALARDDEWQRAYGEINEFERTLADDGVVIIKLFMHISQREQLRRFEERLDNPRKHWKLTGDDLRNRARADDYRLAYEEMFALTDSHYAPWLLVPGDHKWYARTRALQLIVHRLEQTIDTRIPRFSADEIRAAKKQLGLD